MPAGRGIVGRAAVSIVRQSPTSGPPLRRPRAYWHRHRPRLASKAPFNNTAWLRSCSRTLGCGGPSLRCPRPRSRSGRQRRDGRRLDPQARLIANVPDQADYVFINGWRHRTTGNTHLTGSPRGGPDVGAVGRYVGLSPTSIGSIDARIFADLEGVDLPRPRSVVDPEPLCPAVHAIRGSRLTWLSR